MIETTRALEQRRGSAMVEFAVVTPILLLLCVGAGDYARLFFSAISLKSGAAVGALYGSQKATRSGDAYGITTRTLADTEDAQRFAIQRNRAARSGMGP